MEEQTTQNQPQTQAVVPTQAPDKPEKNNFIVILFSILLLISVIVAGYFAYQTQRLAKELQGIRNGELVTSKVTSESTTEPALLSELTSEQNASLDPMATWKTYSNTKYGYSIKYPQDQKVYRLVCENETDMFYMVLGESKDILEPQNCARDSRFNLEMVVSDKPFTFDDRYAYTSQDYMIGKIKAIKMVFTQKPNFEGPGESWYTEIRFENNGYYYDAYIRNKDLSDTLDQILSTFKFTN